MTASGKRSPTAEIQLIIRDDCIICEEVLRKLEHYVRVKENISFHLVDLDKGDTPPNGESSAITPSVWVNGKLWYMGTFDIDRFDERIKTLTQIQSM